MISDTEARRWRRLTWLSLGLVGLVLLIGFTLAFTWRDQASLEPNNRLDIWAAHIFVTAGIAATLPIIVLGHRPPRRGDRLEAEQAERTGLRLSRLQLFNIGLMLATSAWSLLVPGRMAIEVLIPPVMGLAFMRIIQRAHPDELYQLMAARAHTAGLFAGLTCTVLLWLVAWRDPDLAVRGLAAAVNLTVAAVVSTFLWQARLAERNP